MDAITYPSDRWRRRVVNVNLVFSVFENGDLTRSLSEFEQRFDKALEFRESALEKTTGGRTMNRRTSLLPRFGFAAVLALGALGVITSPVFAHVVAVTIDPDGSVAQPGGATVTVSGTLTCTHGTNFVNVAVGQPQGQRVVTAFAFTTLPCAFTQPQGWIVTAPSLQGFHPGPANVIVGVFNAGPDGFNSEQAAATVHLQPE
jgi:hypothetical protein